MKFLVVVVMMVLSILFPVLGVGVGVLSHSFTPVWWGLLGGCVFGPILWALTPKDQERYDRATKLALDVMKGGGTLIGSLIVLMRELLR